MAANEDLLNSRVWRFDLSSRLEICMAARKAASNTQQKFHHIVQENYKNAFKP